MEVSNVEACFAISVRFKGEGGGLRMKPTFFVSQASANFCDGPLSLAGEPHEELKESMQDLDWVRHMYVHSLGDRPGFQAIRHGADGQEPAKQKITCVLTRTPQDTV